MNKFIKLTDTTNPNNPIVKFINIHHIVSVSKNDFKGRTVIHLSTLNKIDDNNYDYDSFCVSESLDDIVSLLNN
jgi:hypothetical protein